MMPFPELRSHLKAAVAGTILFLSIAVPIVFAGALARRDLARALGFSVWTTDVVITERLRGFVRGERLLPPRRAWYLGDSTATSSLAPGEDGFAENLGMAYATTREVYFYARTLLERNPAPPCVALSFSFQWDDAHHEKFWSNFVRLGLFGESELGEIYRDARASREPPGNTPEWLFWLRRWTAENGWTDGPSPGQIQRGLFYYRWWGREVLKLRERIEAAHGAMLFQERGSHFTAPNEDRYRHFPRATPLEAGYLRRLVALLESRGSRVHFVAVPLPRAMAGKREQEYWHAYEKLLSDALGGRPVRLLRAPRTKETRFLTIAHLAERGARSLGTWLRSRLAGCGEAP